MGDVKLLPCPNPWCRSGKVSLRKLLWPKGLNDVYCTCGVNSPAEETEERAIAAWNARPAPALTPKQEAADEMFEALKTVEEANQIGSWVPAMNKVRAALAKAGQP